MAEENNKPKELTEEEMTRMLQAEQQIQQKFPTEITVDGKKYKVKQISKGVGARITRLELEAYFLSGKQKDAKNLRQAKKIQKKLDVLHAKTAAYYLLGNKAVTQPWRYWRLWRKLMMRPEEHCARINDTGANNPNINFSSANWDITKIRLALSMRPIGDGVRETLKRWESASQQVKEDATKKKEEASK